jgi:hypothetical protein
MTQTDMVAMSKLAGDYDKLADRAEARGSLRSISLVA